MKRKSEKYGSRRRKVKIKGGKGAEEDREKQKKNKGTGERTRSGIRKRDGGIRTSGGKRNWSYAPSQPPSPKNQQLRKKKQQMMSLQ